MAKVVLIGVIVWGTSIHCKESYLKTKKFRGISKNTNNYNNEKFKFYNLLQ